MSEAVAFLRGASDAAIPHIADVDRVWAIGAIHGERDRLKALHEVLWSRIGPQDGLVYLGNYLGHGPDICGVIDEVMALRRDLLARPGVHPDSIILLRGAQEEMWRKTWELQFAVLPGDVLRWALEHGMEETLEAYGFHADEAFAAIREGMTSLTRWTARLRNAIRARPNHDLFYALLRRAAILPGLNPNSLCHCRPQDHDNPCPEAGGGLLFVNCGLNPERMLSEQMDRFWWVNLKPAMLTQPYLGFSRIIRGYAPDHSQAEAHAYAVSIDAGCGFGGSLMAMCFDRRGGIQDQITV